MLSDFTLHELDARVELAQAALADAVRDRDESTRYTCEAMVAHWQRERDRFLWRFFDRHPTGDPYAAVSG